MSDAPDRRILPYVSTVILLGGLSAAWLLLETPVPYAEFLTPVIFVFTLCSIVGEAVPLKVFRGNMEGELSTSTTFAVAMMLWAGPAVAFLALAGANIAADLLRGKPVHRIAFNMGQYAISLLISGAALSLTTSLPHEHGVGSFTPGDLPGVLLAGVTFWFVNVALVAAVIAMVQGLGIMRYLIHEWLFQASTAGLLLCGLGPVLVVVAAFSLPAVILLFLPVFAIHRGSRHAIAKEHQSLHDALTGLPNRLLFRDRVDQAITAGRRSADISAVMLMDLDHFKEINDTLGHHHGDRLLEEVALRLQVALRESDTVARLGGDEFGVLLPRVAGAEAASEVANDLLSRLREPFVVDDLTLEVDASIGVACFPGHGEDTETLIQRADIAMYAAKTSSGGSMLFDAAQDRHSPRRLALAGELRSAIQNGQIVLYFQPKADLATGRIVGVEALARWDHPRFGVVGPTEFVPIAEQTGLIGPLTTRVLNDALAQLRQWSESGQDLTVAVNLSARSFLDAQLAVEIPALLERHDVVPARLELELTESMLMHDPQRAQATLERLHGIGVTLAVDDFGTGYSSLANLRRLPVDVIKIDKAFVIDMESSPSDAAIVSATVDLAHSLGLTVVAEGVESDAVWRRLAAMSCDIAQGFHVSRPLPARDLAPLLQRGSLGARARLSAVS
jgi:diguanylate cyclase (GGDEF)-like protein